MDEALRRAGLNRRPLLPGSIWWVNDADLWLPGGGQGERAPHVERPVVVLDGRERCDDGALTYILVAPTSTKVNRVSRYHQILEKGQGELKERTVVLLDLIQPIPRQAFTRRIGQLLPAELERLQAILLANLGLLADSADTGTEWADDLTDREG